MKDDLNRFYNGGGVVYLLQSGAIHFNLTVLPEVGIWTNPYVKLMSTRLVQILTYGNTPKAKQILFMYRILS